MTDTRTYSLAIEAADDGSFLAHFPALPGCHTWASSYEEAVRNAEEALAVYIATLNAHGDPLPDEPATDVPVSLGVMVRTPIIA